MASLRRRLTVSASLTLVLTLGLTAAVLDGAFRETSRALVEERLQAQLYAVLAATEKNPAGQLTVVETPPDPRFATPGSGLYAQLQASEGEVLWRSPSMLAMDIKFPSGAAPGKTEFAPATGHDGEPLFGVAFSASWELDGGQHSRFVVQIAEHRAPFEARLAAFRQRLVLWFTSAGLLTIIVQILVLRWGLGPLARAATQIAEIRAGRRQRLDGEHTEELRPLTDSINRLIDANDQRLSRYRDALGNLAHTLKTPLAVIRSTARTDPADAREVIDEQVERMDRAVAYHLKRAAASGSRALGPAISIHAISSSICAALRKVYADKALSISNTEVGADAVFHGDEGDLLEILGNVMDNACKWARSSVEIRAFEENNETVIEITDDGPGISADAAALVVERGTRADPDTPGHGIGLAVVHQLVCEVYGGQLDFVPRADTGGLNVRIAVGGAVAVE